MKTIIIVLTFFVICQTIIPSFAQSANNESWTWQKGGNFNSDNQVTGVKVNIETPKGEINSKGSLLDYVWVTTNTGDFIQLGFIFSNTQQSKTGFHSQSIFYSDGINPFYYLKEPYEQNEVYELKIFYDEKWWISVKDKNNNETKIMIDWTHGNTTKRGGVFLESVALDSESLVDTKEEVASLENTTHLNFLILKEDSEIEQKLTEHNSWSGIQQIGNYLVHFTVPPKNTIFKQNFENQYNIGFDFEINSEQLNLQVPYWFQKVIDWNRQGLVTDIDISNAIKFLMKNSLTR